MAQPLSVLRDYNTKNAIKQVVQVGSDVHFGDRYSFPAATPVYKAAGAQTAYYSLQDVLFYVKNRLLKPQEYVMAARQAGVGLINIMDRKKVLDVLDGLTDVDPALVPVGAVAAAAAEAAAAGAVGAAAQEPAAKRQRVEDEASAMRGLREQERQLRNRNTMLIAPQKDFRKVLEVVSNVKKQAHKQQLQQQQAAHQGAKPGAGGHRSQEPKSSGRFGRDATADQIKAMAPGSSGSLNINMYGSAAAKAPPPPPPPPSGAAGYVPARRGGGHVPPAAAAGGGGGGGGSAAAAGHKAAAGSSKGGPAATAGAKGDAKKGAAGGGVPIIIVPSGLTAMINMYNAATFLEEGRFVPAAQAQAAAGGAPKPSQVRIKRTAHRSAAVPYDVTDRPPPAGSPDWERVVAVVVQGAKWQFKDWPHKGAKDGDLVEALNRVCGFFVHFADEKVGPPVSDWAVRSVPLHRESRHKDVTAVLDMYKHLDTFLQAKRSSLAF